MSALMPNHAAPTSTTSWQAQFLALLPAIERQARRALRKWPHAEREEALQAIVASAAVACARLCELNRSQLAYASPLVRYGLKQHRAGRAVGSSVHVRDVASAAGQRARGCVLEPLDQWKESLLETRRSTPADLAAFRLDFGDWLQTLSPRNRKLVQALAQGERTSTVARMFRLTAGRVSQLRRELGESWQVFVGEPVMSVN